MRVLVVDDDEDNMEVLTLALTTFHGWNVQGVNSGAQALRICRSCKPDAVVLDVEMPFLDGPCVLVALRADPRTVDLPVIFVTACIEPALLARLRALDALAVLAKPFDIVRIGATLASIPGPRT
jgi:two-component system OmpR family response regulator